MSSEKYYSNDGGHYSPDDDDSLELMDDLDKVFSSMRPDIDMYRRFPKVPSDIVPNILTKKDQMLLGIFLGVVTVGGSLAIIEAWRGLHS